MFKVKVYYEDTDAGGVVYYANYLKFLERARTQYLVDNNFSHTILKKKYDVVTVVRSCNIKYIKPVFLDDVVEISTTVKRSSKILIVLQQKIYCKNILILNSTVSIATINTKGSIVNIPLDLYKIF